MSWASVLAQPEEKVAARYLVRAWTAVRPEVPLVPVVAF